MDVEYFEHHNACIA